MEMRSFNEMYARYYLPSVAETIAEEVFKFGDVINLFDSRIDIVFYPTVFDGFAIEENVTGTPVAIAGLANGANVDHGLATIVGVFVGDVFRAVELQAF